MTNNRLWVIGAVAAIIAVLGLGWLLGVAPKLAEAAIADAEHAAIEQQNLAQEQLLITLREQFENLDDIENDIEELRKEVPSAPDVDEFVDAVQAAAATAGITLERLSASEPTVYGVPAEVTPTDQPPAEPVPVAPEGTYVVPVSIDVQGSPEAIIQFSDLIQRGTRLFVVQTFALAPDSGLSTLTGYLFVVVDATGAGVDAPQE